MEAPAGSTVQQQKPVSSIRGSDQTIDEVLARIDALLNANDVTRAEQLCGDLASQCAPAVYAAGVLALARKDLRGAATLLEAATVLAPRVAEFHLAFARALQLAHEFARSIAPATAALELDESALAHGLLGNAHCRLGHAVEAAEHFEYVVAAQPSDAVAWSTLGLSRFRLEDMAGALTALNRALDITPEFSDAWLNLGRVFAHQGQTAKAIEALRHARNLDPDAAHVNTTLLFALSDAVDVTPDEVFGEHQRWGERLVELVGGPKIAFANEPDPARRLRIGYVSADLRRHPVAFFTAAILSCYSREAFEVSCYFNHESADQTSWQIRGRVDRWVEIAGLSDAEVAKTICDDRIDILVDLSGHTAGERMGVFARRAAPIQVTYLGYTNTTGLPTIDYRITDRWSDPPGQTERFYTERLVRPFESFVCYAPPSGSPDVSPLPALRNDWVTFGSFNRGRKINPEVVELWSRVLKAVPRSRLVTKHALSCREQLLALFDMHGVADRVDIEECHVGMHAHLASYAAVDIGLDTFPWNGITTTCEALWMGVPVLVLAGDQHRSRAGLSLMQNVGLPGFVAQTKETYVERAVAISADLGQLSEVRARLRPQMQASPIMDAEGFTKALEKAYREMWTEWCRETRGARAMRPRRCDGGSTLG